MLEIGDIQLYVTDMVRSLRFWGDGLQLDVVQKEITPHSGFARLEEPNGAFGLQLISEVDPWEEGARPPHGARPGVSFTLHTTSFDDTLVRLRECGGDQIEEVETYNELRVVTVVDPDGNAFELIEAPADES